jgi:hypothetical protein
MSVEIIHSLIKNTEAEILKCKNNIFEATIKFVDISDKQDTLQIMLKFHNKQFNTIKLKNMSDHLVNEKNNAKQEIEILKSQLFQLKEKRKLQKKMLGE